MSVAISFLFSCMSDNRTSSESNGYSLASGESVPEAIDVEVGSLCIIPKVVNENGEQLEFSVKANDDSVVEVNNAKFRATVLSGYVIVYDDGEKMGAVSINVTIKDSVAPVIVVNAPEGMTVIVDSVVSVPTCKISDSSGEEISPEITVTDKDGKSVTVTENRFAASVLGTYTVTYKATDNSGNTATKTLNINCEKADLLNGFEDVSDVGYFADPCEKTLDNEYSSTGYGVKITDTSTENYTYRSLFVPLKKDGEVITLKQLLKYEKVQLTIYSSENNEIGLANETYSITAGQNIIVFSREQIQAGLKFTNAQYSEKEGFLLNLRYGTNGFWMVLDDFIGIYARDYVVPTEVEVVVDAISGVPVLYGSEVTLPTATAVYDGQYLDCAVTVKDKTGATVEVTDGKFITTTVGLYTAEYTVATSGYEGCATIEFVCRYGTLLNDFASVDCVTYAKNEETTNTKELTKGYDGNGVKITAIEDFAYEQVRLPIKDSKGYVTAENFSKYEKLVFVVYAGNGLKICTANANESYDIAEGWNVVSFSVANYVAAGNFAENANGIYLCVHGLKAGNEIIFDAIYGLYEENYVPPVAGEITVNAVNGEVVIKDSEITLPSAVAEDENGNALEYEIIVKDSTGATVSVSADGKFTPSVLGDYELTYIITSAGYDGTASVILKCKKALLLNSFDARLDVPYVINNDTTELTEVTKTYKGNGVKVYAPDGMSWAQIQIGAKDEDGYITWENFQKFKSVQFVVYSSSSATFCTATASECIGVTEGWNVVEFNMAAIVAAGNFREDANGFYLCVNGLGGNEYLIFDSFFGIYDDDYEPAKVAELIIDSVSGLTAICGSEYVLPNCTAKYGDVELQYETAVKDSHGNVIEIKENKFAVTNVGTYIITYKITSEGYEGETAIEVNAKKGNLLNNFEKASDMTYIQADYKSEIIDVISGKGMKITANAAFSWARVSFPVMENGEYLTLQNLKKYEKIRFIIYVSNSLYVCTANNNENYTLQSGWNFVDFSVANVISATGFEENANGYYLCVNALAANEYFVMYAVYGIYADDYVPPVAGELKINSTDGLIALFGKEYTIPDYVATDADGNKLACSIVVKDRNLSEVTVVNGKFLANVLGSYTIIYTLTEEGYEGEKSITVECKKGNLLNNFEKVSDMTYIQADYKSEIVDVISGKGMKITANAAFSWARVSFPVMENGSYLTAENLVKYTKIRFTIYCEADGVYVCTSNNSEGYTLKKGWNTVEFDVTNVAAAPGFEENANGYYLCVNNLAQGDSITMYSVYGIYADDYAG